MAEEAFALSPISASPASPTDADYHAIREAFMETSRGRWFLTEYARRNRNADTAMVLEAVARIEQNLSAAQGDPSSAPSSDDLPEAALTALEKARAAIRTEFSETTFDHTLMPWRKSARIIREIVWGLRESGADPRICNILDGQVRAIEAACDDFPLADIRDRIIAALDNALSQEREAGSVMAERVSEKSAAAEIDPDAAPAAAAEQPLEARPETAVADTAVPAATTIEAPIMEPAVAEAVAARIEAAADIIAPASSESPSPEAVSFEAVAPEIETSVKAAAEASPAPMAIAETPQPAPAIAAPRSIMTASASPQPPAQPMAERPPAEALATGTASQPQPAAAKPGPENPEPEALTQNTASEEDLWADIESEIAPLPPLNPAHQNSLGASLIAQGVVEQPANARPDLLAPIRRMSHAERIAFFS